jgi:hypothetical protein
MLQTIEKITRIEDLINDSTFNINNWYGYIYLTVDIETNKQYIGKKNFFLTQNKKLGKKESAALPVKRGKKPTKKKVVKESDWKTYYGSSEEIKLIPKERLERYLIKLCRSSKELTYYEAKYLFTYGVIEPGSTYINDNIQGRFFRKDLYL